MTHRAKKATYCYGFGERQDNCPNVPGGKWSPYFCPECDEARMAHLGAQFKKLAANFSRVSP
jgi:hypothetical protein